MGLFNDFSYGLFFWLVLIFLGLLFLLKAFAWRPILNAIEQREEGIRKALEEAEKARKEMQNLQADNQRILKEARAERDMMLKEAREMKEKMISEAKEEAKQEADKEIQKAKSAIDAEKKSAMAELKHKVGQLSIDIAQKVVADELSNKDKHLQLVDKMLKEVNIN